MAVVIGRNGYARNGLAGGTKPLPGVVVEDIAVGALEPVNGGPGVRLKAIGK